MVESLVVTLDMYRRAFSRGAVLAVKNWPVSSRSSSTGRPRSSARRAAGYLGIVGGFLMSLLHAACLGSLLYLVEMIVRRVGSPGRTFGRSFGMYLWDLVGVTFALWVFGRWRRWCSHRCRRAT